MNIFYFSHDPIECSQMHCDKHVVKMILEYAQLLSTAHRVLDNYVGEECYKSTHKNHPSAVWVRKSDQNYLWLYRLFIALQDEYTYRYNKIHASSRLNDFLKEPPKNILWSFFTQPTPAMPDKYIIEGESIISYRNYFNGEKTHLAKWSGREEPIWYQTI